MSVEANPVLQPGQIGPLHLPNRVIMAPMTTRKADRARPSPTTLLGRVAASG
jgi:2,4-dienoyl-CoA reductase-like NADH-dependent reductase (Old Yellow Enzyme family)